MNLVRYSIVFQGLIEKVEEVDNIISFKEEGVNIIVATWVDTLKNEFDQKFCENGIKIVYMKDPGSEKAYKDGVVQKYLNLNRRILGFREGILSAEYDKVILTRVDLRFNSSLVINKYLSSKKRIAVVNVNTVCPYRLLSPKYFLAISDWIIVGHKSDFLKSFDSIIEEKKLIVEKSYQIGSQVWNSTLAAEQVFSLLLMGKKSKIFELSNNDHQSIILLETYHNVYIKDLLLINWRDISLSSTKYTRFSYDWTSYQNEDFSDNKKFQGSIISFLFFLGSKLRSTYFRF